MPLDIAIRFVRDFNKLQNSPTFGVDVIGLHLLTPAQHVRPANVWTGARGEFGGGECDEY